MAAESSVGCFEEEAEQETSLNPYSTWVKKRRDRLTGTCVSHQQVLWHLTCLITLKEK